MELVDNPSHTFWHHTEVFCAYEHLCRLYKSWEFLHSLLIPELIVPSIEIIVIQTVEVVFVVLPKRLVTGIELC